MSHTSYHIFVFSNYPITKIVCIADYLSRYVRMMKVDFDIQNLMNTLEKIIRCHCFTLEICHGKRHYFLIKKGIQTQVKF